MRKPDQLPGRQKTLQIWTQMRITAIGRGVRHLDCLVNRTVMPVSYFNTKKPFSAVYGHIPAEGLGRYSESTIRG